MQAFDKFDDALWALTSGDSHSKVLKRFIRLNKVHAVLLITAVTVLGSELITTALMLSFSAPESWVAIGLCISTVCPLVLAPMITVLLLSMVHLLERSREMITELAMTDMLTGSYNRRYFMLQAQEEFTKSERYNLPLSIILFNADRFKSLNDTYGHDTGDNVLRQLGTTCMKSLRSSDIFARYGGEEFIILPSPMNSQHTASQKGSVEKLRK
jgi:predicted signal transduction protein with EAL and GGDEF domain